LAAAETLDRHPRAVRTVERPSQGSRRLYLCSRQKAAKIGKKVKSTRILERCRKPMHGYALAQHIKAISDHLLQIEEGSLSPALQRMLKTGTPADSLCLQSRTHGHFIVAEAAEMVEMLNQGRLSPPIYCCGLGQFMPGVRIHA